MIHEVFIPPEEQHILTELLGQELISARVTGWNAELQIGSRFLHIFPAEVVVPIAENRTREFRRPKFEFITRPEQTIFKEILSAPFRIESIDVLRTLVMFTNEIKETVITSSVNPIAISSYGPEYLPPSEAKQIDGTGMLAGMVDIGIEMKGPEAHSIVFFAEAYSIEHSLDGLPEHSQWVSGRSFVRRQIGRVQSP